jgi:nucleoside permease NupC
MIFEVVSLLNSLLAIQSDEVVSRLPQEAQSAFEKRVVVRSQLEQRKFAFQSSAEMEDKIRQMALELLPRIFLVFESTINSEYKMRILEVINKIVGLMTDSLLRSSICPI